MLEIDASRNSFRPFRDVPPVIWMLLALVGAFSIVTPRYFSVQNMANVLLQSSPLMILAFGQTLVILTQGTDLSLGAQVSFVTVIWIFLAQTGLSIYAAALLAVLLSVTAGAINGLVVAKGKIPPFIATLGMQNVLFSIALLITEGASIYFPHDIYPIVTETRFLHVPLPAWITVAMFLLTWTLLNRTRFGMHVFCLGGNPEALSLAGGSVVKSTVKAYAFAGFLAGVTGLITACRVECGLPIVGMGWEFDAVAAALLGGTSLREGRGGVTGTIFGVLLITIIKNGLNLAGVSAMYQNAIIGTIVLAALVADVTIRRLRTA